MVLRANAASCLGFGALFTLYPGGVARYLGAPPAPETYVLVLGVVLIVHGVTLLLASRRDRLPRGLLWSFSGGDFAWVAATLILIAGSVGITQDHGKVAALAVACVVGAMGMLQLYAANAERPPRHRR